MARIQRSHRVLRIVGGVLAFGLCASLYVLTLMGAGRKVVAFDLAAFFIAFPLVFLAMAPPAKPGLDPLTAKYYHPGTYGSEPNSSDTDRPDDAGGSAKPPADSADHS